MQETAEARILLVSSDVERVRRHLDRLSGVGYVVRTCAPNADGQSLVEQFDPLVTVVDVGASSGDAVEFLDRGRRTHPSCGFIALPDVLSPAEGVINGVDLPAPHEAPADVLPLVERALERSRKER